ncbi:MAG: hypothetical protein IT378_18075 [Sandaracinaceae bacterium]|nr:hypothetical protein [Sandaracinaceae bacterium]MCC6876220.1 hypothetical protein [Sandaracinaceae bacterium]
MTQKSRIATLTLVLVAGVLAGILGERLTAPARAQPSPGRLTECTALSLHWHDGAAFANPAWRPQTIPIRQGWTVVGGASAGNAPYAVVCR